MKISRGNFVILDEARFPRPYVRLASEIEGAIELDARETVKGFSSLKHAFRQHWQENTNLEYLHLTDVYQQLVKRVCNESEFRIGPKGNRESTFDIAFKSRTGKVIKPNKQINHPLEGPSDDSKISPCNEAKSASNSFISIPISSISLTQEEGKRETNRSLAYGHRHRLVNCHCSNSVLAAAFCSDNK